MSAISENKGRVRYIEPTNIKWVDGEPTIVPSDINVNNPLEDYCLALDLQVVIPDRKSCGFVDQTGEKVTLNYSSNNGTISFLNGTDGYLTTNFTDVNLISPEGNTRECLGIETISIEYNSWIYPQVTVKFVDVRGATVMSPMEETYQNEAGNGSFYKALFTYPYPMFKLKVKGFYGRGATYYLTVEDVKIDFDSNTGNFNITVKFIGMMYRIYTDIPMTYLCISPYTDTGMAYWDEQVAAGNFRFVNRDGSTAEMYKFPELRLKLAMIANNEAYIDAAATGELISNNIDEQKNKLMGIKDSCPVNNWCESNNHYFIISAQTEDTKWVGELIDKYISTVSGYDQTYNTTYLKEFESLQKYGTEKKGYKNIETVFYERDKETGKLGCSSKKDSPKNYEKYIKGDEKLAKAIDDYIAKNKPNTFEIFILDADGGSIKNFLDNTVRNALKELDNRQSESRQEYQNLQSSIVEKVLGFRPSIKNIFNLAFAHMDTFVHTFQEHMKVIKDQMDGNSDVRMALSYDAKTDLPLNEVILPPFPGFYKEETRDGKKTNVSKWPEDLMGGSKMEEVVFVKELLEASKLYNDRNDEVNKIIEQLAKRREGENGDGNDGDRHNGGAGGTDELIGAPSIGIRQFIPLTTYDLVNKDKMGNPYSQIKKLASESDSSMKGAIFEAFALRAFYYLCTNDDKGKEARAFGKLEAVNFAKGVGKQASDEFISFIKSYADEKGERGEKRDFIKEITSNAETDITKAWRFGMANANNSLFKESNGVLSYNLYKGKDYTFLPMAYTNLESVKRDFGSGEKALCNNGNYCTTTKYTDSGLSNSFYIYDSRDYVNELYKAIENACQEAESSKDYIDLANENRTLKNYKNNVDSIFDDNTYVRNIIVDAEGKTVGGAKLKDLLNKSYSTRDNYYIKYPAIVDEKTDDSLFDDDFFKKQSDVKVRALLFLNAMPVRGKKGGIDDISDNGVALRARLLREGGLYWREQKCKEGKDPVKWVEGYKKVEARQTFCGDLWSDGYETYHMLRNGIKNYPNWTEPLGTSPSRKKVLIDEFLKWVSNEYSQVEIYLKNDNYYARKNDKESNPRKKSNGLDINLAKNTERTDSEIMNAKKIQSFLRNTFFSVSTVLDYYNGIIYDDEIKGSNRFKCSTNSMKNAFDGFMDGLNEIYSEDLKKIKENPDALSIEKALADAEDPFNNRDLRLATYMTLKSLYDKWLCSPYKGINTWKLGAEGSDFETFKYLDVFYHDIGYDILANTTKMVEWINNCLPSSNVETNEGEVKDSGKSLYQFLADMAQHTGGMLMAFPQMIGGCNEKYMADMFKAMPFNSEWDTDSSCFCFMYTYRPSEHLGTDQYEDDGIDLCAQEIVGALSDDGYDIPAFGVTYAKQNQAFFKNITLNTESAGVTEASLAATFAIASKGSESARETSLFGQDLYKVRTSYAYQCEFDMMGDVQIMPLMYFQLQNIPFWRGAYVIYKVSHQMSAGDMTTHVTGVRINRNSLPITEGAVIISKKDPDTVYGGGTAGNTVPLGNSGNGTGNGGSTTTETYGTGTATNEDGNPNYVIPKTCTIDFDESNVTPQKPIICLTPAHGPKTQKYQEWIWSTQMIDKYLIPILKTFKFKDGTSYAKNIQRCNKGGANTGKGYSTRETQNLIKKYGSDKVISVVPHWNGCAGDYHGVFVNKLSKPIREDSKKFAECMNNAVIEMANKLVANDTTLPIGSGGKKAINPNGCKVRNLGENNSDGAPQLNCACILTENWFADFPKGCKWWDDSKYAEMEEGRYKTFRGWLMSANGSRAIAEMHAKGIKNYIDSLS